MAKFRFCVARPRSRTTLSDIEIKSLDAEIVKNNITISNDNFKKFVTAVGKMGAVVCPSTFAKGIKSASTFKQSQLLILYFDELKKSENKSVSFNAMIDRAQKYDLPVLFAYDSFSFEHTEKLSRFCLAFLLDTPFFEVREIETLQKAIMMIFPEAVKNCSPIKTYQGGNKVLYWDKSMPTLDAEWLVMQMCLYLKDNYGITNYKRKILEFSKSTGVALTSKKLPIISIKNDFAESYKENYNDKNLPKRIIDSSNSGKMLSNRKYQIELRDDEYPSKTSSDRPHQCSRRSYRSTILESLDPKCRLYHQFLSDEERLSQQELLGLASNLAQIEGGFHKFKSTLSTRKYYYDNAKYDNWNFRFYYMRGSAARPCSSFCPYHDTCAHGHNILSTCTPRRHQIERGGNYDNLLVGLEEAEQDFIDNLNKAIESDCNGWHIIKSQTALGKTQTILQFLAYTQLKVLVAVPTNILKREVCERAKKMEGAEINMVASPSLHELKDVIPDGVWDDIQQAYDRGMSPMPRLEKAIAENDLECAKLFKHYKKELEEFNKASGHAITTHRRLTSLDLRKYDLVIVDEDIIYSTVIPSRETVSISMLKKLKKKLAASDSLAAKIRKILKKVKTAKYFALDEIDYCEAYSDIKIGINIPALCSAKIFCSRKASERDSSVEEDSVSFIKPVRFQDNTKYIMLSATADKTICEYCFGEDNVHFYGL